MRQIASLGHNDAEIAIRVIKAEAEKRNKPVVIAVADAFGELLALLRMDGAPLPSTLVATNKAFTAARERKPSGDIGKASRDLLSGFDLRNFGDSRYLGWGGGIPVIVDGKVVGAVAVSGLHESEDVELAEMGIAAMTI